MKKNYFATLLSILLYSTTFCQSTESLFIDSLKKLLPHLKDTSRIDGLNLVAEKFPKRTSWTDRADSVYHYASLAFTEAKKIGYKKGIAQSLGNLGYSEFLRGIDLRINKKNDSASVYASEKYLLEAITLAEEINNDAILAEAYYNLSDILFFKSKQRDFKIRDDYLKKAVYYFQKAGNEEKEGEGCTWLCERYSDRGFYEEGIDYCRRSMELAKKAVTKTKTVEEKEYRNYLVQQSLLNMASLYTAAGDYNTAFDYGKQARVFGIENKTGWTMEAEIAGLFQAMGQYDSAFYYIKQVTNKDPKKYNVKAAFGKLGQVYLKTKDYEKALKNLLASVDSLGRGRTAMPFLISIGDAYAGKANYKMALKYGREGTGIAARLNARPELMQGYELLSRVHRGLGRNDSAYLYLLRYIRLKDSIQNRQFLWRLNNYKRAAEEEKKTSQLGFLMRDNKIKAQQLKQEALFKKFLFIALIAFLLIGIFVFRTLRLKRKNERLKRIELEQQLKVQQLENEKQHAELNQKATELEMQALRAQMNPHFIFNCLSSINRFILKNETEVASDYLTRFSRLIRMVLINSQQSLITLEDELEMLRLYLEMERLRFKNAFNYNITFINRIDAGSVYIPPLLLQPFCENAVWHGLMHKEEKGQLSIALSMEEQILHCSISDNGIGRQKSAEMKSKSVEKDKSLGLKITSERLALLNGEKGISTFYEIIDIVDEEGNVAGTRVDVKIKYKESVEEYF